METNRLKHQYEHIEEDQRRLRDSVSSVNSYTALDIELASRTLEG